ncbi:MAG: DUF4214 domain-containing protein [Lachnospiraceae bacterium]
MKLKRVIALGLCVSTVLASTFVSATPTETSSLASAQVTVVEESSDSLPEAFTETALDETESQASESESTEAVPAEVAETEVAETEAAAESTAESTSIPETSASETIEAEAASTEANDLAGFVTRLYQICLDRTPDANGLQSWIDVLQNHRDSGAGVAFGFVFSPEYQKKNTSNDEYVTMLYRVMLGREPDASGKASWIKLMQDGVTRKYIFAGFIGSKEFTGICNSYGVDRGDYQSDDVRDRQPAVTSFVVRLYREVLGRSYDPNGLTNWVTGLLNKTIKGSECAWGFLNSDEFIKKNVSDSEFLDILYNVFFDRGADTSGKQAWQKVLDSGLSRQHVVSGFAGSQEYLKLCASYGIEAAPEVIRSTENRDQNQDLTALVMRYYTYALGRKPLARDLNDWTGRLMSKSISGTDLTLGFFTCDEYANRGRSNSEFVSDVYLAMLGRSVDAPGLNNWISLLNSGTSRRAVCTMLADSQEFIDQCNRLGIVYAVDGWNNGLYYYKNGKKLSGWQTISGNQYYFNPNNGNEKQTGWGYVDGYKYYFGDNGVLRTDLRNVLGKQSSYFIRIIRDKNVVQVYAKDGSNGYIIPVVNFVCSTGGSNTPLGTFRTQNQYRWHELMGPCWGQWCTRIVNGVLFHSVFYSENGNASTLSVSAYNKLGVTASHGCIRLTAGDAKWIYDNCSLGTTVQIVEDGDIGRYGKPSAYKLSSSHTWDPTDPNMYYKCRQKGCH